MFNLASLAKTVKTCTKNPSRSDEAFLNDFLSPIVNAGNIKAKTGQPFELDKTRVSRLMNGKDDVPGALREARMRFNIQSRVRDEFDGFIEDNIDAAEHEGLSHKLCILVNTSENLTTEEKQTILSQQNELNAFLAELLLAAIRVSNIVKDDAHILLRNGANTVDVLAGDLFKYGFENRKKRKNIVVIPANTAFDTHVTRKIEHEPTPLVSENTLHGQWLIRWEYAGNSIQELNQRIAESLVHSCCETDPKVLQSSGKSISYPIGTVVVIESSKSIYYLLAVSSFDEHNNARSTHADIKTALEQLISFYDTNGQGYDMYLPLIGTGMSRAGLSLQSAYSMIVRVLQENLFKIHGNIHIVLKPEAMQQIDLQEM